MRLGVRGVVHCCSSSCVQRWQQSRDDVHACSQQPDFKRSSQHGCADQAHLHRPREQSPDRQPGSSLVRQLGTHELSTHGMTPMLIEECSQPLTLQTRSSNCESVLEWPVPLPQLVYPADVMLRYLPCKPGSRRVVETSCSHVQAGTAVQAWLVSKKDGTGHRQQRHQHQQLCIPHCLFEETADWTVMQGGNLLSGSLPDMSAMSGLSDFNLPNNRLSGSLPAVRHCVTRHCVNCSTWAHQPHSRSCEP